MLEKQENSGYQDEGLSKENDGKENRVSSEKGEQPRVDDISSPKQANIGQKAQLQQAAEFPDGISAD